MTIEPIGTIVERKLDGNRCTYLEGVIYATGIVGGTAKSGTLLYSEYDVAKLIAERDALLERLEFDWDDCR